MAFTWSEANDLAYALLDHYIRGPALYQTLQERPLMRFLTAGQKTFPAGKQYVKEPVKGTLMSATSGFFAGYTGADELSFYQSQNLLQTSTAWKEVHSGFVVAWTELKMDGITVGDNNKRTDHPGAEVDRLVELFQDRMMDFAESWSVSMNEMLWKDGSQDSKQAAGLLSILTDDPTSGTACGLSRATYSWWRHNAWLNIVPSETNQTLLKTVRNAQRVLRKRGGRPNKFLAGSDFIEALESELQAKGYFSMTGFTSEGKTDFGIADVSLRGVGNFEYDPWLDDNGLTAYCYEIDSRRLRLRPMAGEANKLLNPERPYNYMVFLKSMTWTGCLTSNQMNCHGVFSVGA